MSGRSLFLIICGELLANLRLVGATVGIEMLLKHGLIERELLAVMAVVDADFRSLSLVRKDSRYDHALVESFLGPCRSRSSDFAHTVLFRLFGFFQNWTIK